MTSRELGASRLVGGSPCGSASFPNDIVLLKFEQPAPNRIRSRAERRGLYEAAQPPSPTSASGASPTSDSES